MHGCAVAERKNRNKLKNKCNTVVSRDLTHVNLLPGNQVSVPFRIKYSK